MCYDCRRPTMHTERQFGARDPPTLSNHKRNIDFPSGMGEYQTPMHQQPLPPPRPPSSSPFPRLPPWHPSNTKRKTPYVKHTRSSCSSCTALGIAVLAGGLRRAEREIVDHWLGKGEERLERSADGKRRLVSDRIWTLFREVENEQYRGLSGADSRLEPRMEKLPDFHIIGY